MSRDVLQLVIEIFMKYREKILRCIQYFHVTYEKLVINCLKKIIFVNQIYRISHGGAGGMIDKADLKVVSISCSVSLQFLSLGVVLPCSLHYSKFRPKKQLKRHVSI